MNDLWSAPFTGYRMSAEAVCWESIERFHDFIVTSRVFGN
jgi:hypothetical protein